jgi:TPR repeat protein
MKTPSGVLVLAFVATAFSGQAAEAQIIAPGPSSGPVAVQKFADGLAMERRGDQLGAYVAYLALAQDGYPPAQRRLGEIYDTGNRAVDRDFYESVRWYQKAREGGETIPAPKSRLPEFNQSP